MIRFTYLFFLAGKSAWNRRGTLLLVVLSIALSTTLLLGLERVRTQVRESFVQAVSGVDLVVGARGGDMQLMLYAVFHLGGATNNMSWKSALSIAARPDVAWSVPISLGDSHNGYPVVGTSADFFTRYRFRGGRELQLAQGGSFSDLFDVVTGSEVAKKHGYVPGSRIILSHGNSGAQLARHEDKPFVVSGVLRPTGTPVDRSLYISLEAMEAIHLNWQGGAPIRGLEIRPDQVRKFNLEPKSITALLVGMKSRSRVFALQQDIRNWKEEALTGVMPGVAMDQIWRLVSTGEQALFLVSGLVIFTGLAGLASAILAGLGERRRELAILRSAGARPLDILILLACEGFLLLCAGMACGLLLLVLLLLALGPTLADSYGIALHVSPPGTGELLLLGGIAAAGFLTCLIPAWRAYRLSLADGLTAST
ncbi:MAG: ABC transporter permease [Deltaproteobacteria bacterium]|jgi:putative ABC transport system permease protein|nr:ABC transporter permease [Deltaproteobacteria bacterium]